MGDQEKGETPIQNPQTNANNNTAETDTLPYSDWGIFPELTERDNNYDDIQNQQVAQKLTAQPQRRENKRMGDTEVHIAPDRTAKPTSPENRRQDNRYAIEQKQISQASVARPKLHDVESTNSNNVDLINNASGPTLLEHTEHEHQYKAVREKEGL